MTIKDWLQNIHFDIDASALVWAILMQVHWYGQYQSHWCEAIVLNAVAIRMK